MDPKNSLIPKRIAAFDKKPIKIATSTNYGVSNSVPSLKGLLAHADQGSKQDTFDLTKGHLGKVPKVPRNIEVQIENLNGISREDDPKWGSSKMVREIVSPSKLPPINSSTEININGVRSEKVKTKKFTPDPVSKSDVFTRDFTLNHPPVHGLTHSETLRHYERMKKDKHKQIKIKLPMLMPSIDETCGDPELWLSYTEQAMAKLAQQNQIFGPVLTEIKGIYDEYIASLRNSSTITIDHNKDESTKFDFGNPGSTVEQNAKITHDLEKEALLLATGITETNKQIAKEKVRVTDEKAHFDKFKFLHHEKPLVKAKPTLEPRNEHLITDVERMNENIHEILELVEKVGAIETEINGKLENSGENSGESEFVMKADFDRAKAEYADKELEFLNLEKQLEISEKEAQELEKSCLFFLRNNPEFENEYKEIVECDV